MKNRAIHAMISSQFSEWELNDINVEFLYSEGNSCTYQIKHKGIDVFCVTVVKFKVVK